ncbi:MAG: hypothetical protein IS632_03450 [Thaumarchaeota archaeon]|nr:hypothetical protein [Nitrososphaerota archaeon]
MRRGGALVAGGLALVAALFAWYHRYQSPETLTPQAVDAILWLSQMFYVLLLACLGMTAWGMYILSRDSVHGGGMLATVAAATRNRRAQVVFVSVFVVYGTVFSLASGTLVYQPGVDFEEHYGAQIPSAFISPCCGDMGYMPTILVYVTHHVGLQIIPINLVLQIAVSYLVALNAALATAAYSASRGARGAGTLGAITGLFVACPTCAGAASSIFLGAAGGIALSVALAQLQTLFIAVSIPVLLATPLLLARRMASCRPN